MHHRFRPFFLLCLATVAVPAVCRADGVEDIDWESTPIINHSTLQGVDSNGVRTYPVDGFPVRLRGILLNNPEDMLDSTPTGPPAVGFNLGPMWQVFVQTTTAGDFGGTALFMGQYYGNVPPHGPPLDLSLSYTDEEWLAEVDRVNHDRATGHQFRAGDLVEIRAQGGLYFGGKTNVNEEHFIEPELDFELALITAGHGLPVPIPLTLDEIWDDTTDQVIFDDTRLTGGEHYQGSLVELRNVRLASDPADWLPGALLLVEDADGRTFNLHLGLDSDFGTIAPPTGYFNAVGIFNQEFGGPFGPGTAGYELWVMDPARINAVPEPAGVVLLATGLLALHGWRRAARWTR